jgi:hypothetical protein
MAANYSAGGDFSDSDHSRFRYLEEETKLADDAARAQSVQDITNSGMFF